MNHYLAVMAIIGQLTTCYLLGYPVVWVLDHTFLPVANYLQRKHIEWDEAYRS